MSPRDRLGVDWNDLRHHLMDGHDVDWRDLESADLAVTDHHEWLHGLGRSKPPDRADHHHLRVLKREPGT